MFLTGEQVEQLQGLCEEVAGSRTRSGKITIVINNNMPRSFEVEVPAYNEDHVQIGSITKIIRMAIPQEERRKNRQKNRMKPKKG